MSSVRLSKATKELNISLDRAVEELAKHGHEIPNNRNHKITNDQYEVLMTAFADDLARKKRSEEVSQQVKEEKEILRGTKDTAEAPVAEVAPKPAEEAPAVEAVPAVEAAPEKPEPVAAETPATAEESTPEAAAPEAPKAAPLNPKKLVLQMLLDSRSWVKLIWTLRSQRKRKRLRSRPKWHPRKSRLAQGHTMLQSQLRRHQ
jgi:translation initiation factor IF-2